MRIARLSRFAVVGGVCALLNNALVITLVWSGVGYVLASMLAFGPVLVVGYALHAAATFRVAASRRGFARYALAMLPNYPAWVAALYVLCDLLGLPVTIAAPVATALLMICNYALAHWAILRPARAAAAGSARG